MPTSRAPSTTMFQFLGPSFPSSSLCPSYPQKTRVIFRGLTNFPESFTRRRKREGVDRDRWRERFQSPALPHSQKRMNRHIQKSSAPEFDYGSKECAHVDSAHSLDLVSANSVPTSETSTGASAARATPWRERMSDSDARVKHRILFRRGQSSNSDSAREPLERN